MLRIEKKKTAESEVTTIGVDLFPAKVKPSAVSGAVVGFLLAGIPGVILGGLVGEATSLFVKESKE